MTGRERNLLGLLGAAALLSTCALWAFSSLERLREVDSSIDRYRGQLKRIEARASEDPVILDARIEELKKNVENLEKRSSDSGEGSGLAEFGARVRASLVAARVLFSHLVPEEHRIVRARILVPSRGAPAWSGTKRGT